MRIKSRVNGPAINARASWSVGRFKLSAGYGRRLAEDKVRYASRRGDASVAADADIPLSCTHSTPNSALMSIPLRNCTTVG